MTGIPGIQNDNDTRPTLDLTEAIRLIEGVGLKVVPAEPTDDMIKASIGALDAEQLSDVQVGRSQKHRIRLRHAIDMAHRSIVFGCHRKPRSARDVDGMLFPLTPDDIPDESLSLEINYKTLRAAYWALASSRAQISAQIDDTTNKEDLALLHNKLSGLNSDIGEMRNLTREAGDLAYSTVFFHVAHMLLKRNAWSVIEKEVERIMQRPRHEIGKGAGGRRQIHKGRQEDGLQIMKLTPQAAPLNRRTS